MTEQEWLACDKPLPMLQYLRFKQGVRKLRLFTAACHRRQWHYLSQQQRIAVETAEQLAEGRTEISRRSLRAAKADADAALHAAGHAISYSASTAIEALLLRDVFGNPFHRIAFDSTCLPRTVLALAQTVYDNRSLPVGTLDTTLLAILADALEESGCTSEDVMNHCRSPGPIFEGAGWSIAYLGGSDQRNGEPVLSQRREMQILGNGLLQRCECGRKLFLFTVLFCHGPSSRSVPCHSWLQSLHLPECAVARR